MAHVITSSTYSTSADGSAGAYDTIKYEAVDSRRCPTKDVPRGVSGCEAPAASTREHDITRFRPVDTGPSFLSLPDPVKPFQNPSAAPVVGL